MQKENVITVIGSSNYDITLKQDRLPKLGETYTVNDINFSSGGKGANQATQCAKLGAKTYFVGCIGKDDFGNYLYNSLKNSNVDLSYIKRTSTVTGIGIVNALNDGSVYANIYKGANFDITKSDIDNIKPLIIKSKIIILQLEIPVDVVEYVINIANQNGCYIILNGAPAKEISQKALNNVNCFVVNEEEASFYSQKRIKDIESATENCKYLDDKFKELLIITLGEKGSILYDKNEIIHIPAVKAKAVDTTGAGDSYIGAFAYKLLNNASYVDAAKFAANISAITVSKLGSQCSMPNINEI